MTETPICELATATALPDHDADLTIHGIPVGEYDHAADRIRIRWHGCRGWRSSTALQWLRQGMPIDWHRRAAEIRRADR